MRCCHATCTMCNSQSMLPLESVTPCSRYASAHQDKVAMRKHDGRISGSTTMPFPVQVQIAMSTKSQQEASATQYFLPSSLADTIKAIAVPQSLICSTVPPHLSE